MPLPPLLSRRSSALLRRTLSTATATRKLPILHKPKSSSDPPHTLQLFSWGKGASGQLGGGVADETRLYPGPVADILVPSASSFALAPAPGRLLSAAEPLREGVVEVGPACGLFHSAIAVDGKLWMWGKGDAGRLGFGHEKAVFEPALNLNVEGVRILDMGALNSFVLTRQGQLFSWGYGGFGSLGHFVFRNELFPRFVDGSWRGKKIRHFATGPTHIAAIIETGELYTWGRDEHQGRLGLGPDRGPDEDSGGGLAIPTKVEALPVPVAAVSCGSFFTTVLTEDGKVWNFGENVNYELGRGDTVGGWEPKPLTSLENVRIIQVACGGYHTLALTDDGKVLSWGHGGNGQLGHSSLDHVKVPTEIKALADKRVVYINCVGSTSAAVTDDGKLYMWGNGRDSQLGVPGLPDVQQSPVMVNFLSEDDGLGPHKVVSVSVGACHTICLVSRSSE